jgi:hypothetical protein
MAGEPVEAQNNMAGASGFAGKERVIALRRGFSSILKAGLRGSER